MKNYIIKAIRILLVLVCLTVSIQRAEAQLGDDESSVSYLATQIGSSAGQSADNYRVYAEKLAKTMSYLGADQQAVVFGFVPTPTVEAKVSPLINGAPSEPVEKMSSPPPQTDLVAEVDSGSSTQTSSSGNLPTDSDSTQEASGSDSGGSPPWWQAVLDVIEDLLMGGESSIKDPSDDGNNGHGNDPGKRDSSNPGQGSKS